MIRDQELADLCRTIGRDAGLSVTVGGKRSYIAADANHINIAAMPMTPQGRILAVGLVWHESAHKLYTDFSLGGPGQGLLGSLANIIEDARVDRDFIAQRPGSRYDTELLDDFYAAKGSMTPTDEAQALCAFVMGQARAQLTSISSFDADMQKGQAMLSAAFGEELVRQAQVICAEFPHLPKARVGTHAAKEFARRLHDLFVQAAQGPKPPASPPKASSQPSTEEPGAQAKPQPTGRPAGNGAPADLSSPEKRKAHLLRQAAETCMGDRAQAILQELDQLAGKQTGTERPFVPELPLIDRAQPLACVDEALALQATAGLRARLYGLLQAMKNLPVTHGCSGKRLDERRLHRLSLDDPRIFRRRQPRVDVHTAVCLLLDASGSMNRPHRGQSYIELASLCAYALHRALRGLPGVAVWSAEFSKAHSQRFGRDVEVREICGWQEKPSPALFGRRGLSNTPVCSGLWAARAELLARPEPRRIVLLLTDGVPSDTPGAVADTSLRLHKDGIEVAAIGIKEASVQRHWKNHRVIGDPSQLAQAMFHILTTLLTSRRQRAA
ncbi:hypothetical protein [Geoalkalibacter halelectricus]|uniref:hypothetical protein n=1 Tax=Geoalkalibacter halelectricus TaxID=2847045 RepID=UPI003D236EE4